ncbi:MAG: acetyl-CoA carboxylase carboxyl transferase subunit beta, partial [Acidobacteria bacterium]
MKKGQGVPRGLWVKCEGCGAILYHEEAAKNSHVCPKCDYHFRMTAHQRLESLFDGGRYKTLFNRIRSTDPLEFEDSKAYKDRIKAYQKKIGPQDAVVVGQGDIERGPTIVAAMEYGFMGGSMGSAVSEKIALAGERCLDRRLPLVVVSCSGGARMQEGILSLMQMAKISAVLARMREK